MNTTYRDAHNMSRDVKEAFVNILSEYSHDKGDYRCNFYRECT